MPQREIKGHQNQSVAIPYQTSQELKQSSF